MTRDDTDRTAKFLSDRLVTAARSIPRTVPEQIETERLILRCPRPGDGAVIYEAVLETLDDLRAWPASLPWAEDEPSIANSELFCSESNAAYTARESFPMLLFLKADGRYIGGSGLHNIDWSVPKFETGYWCRKQYQGRGLMIEAVKAVTAFAFEILSAERVTSLPDALNYASRMVAEHAGFHLEGIMKSERRDPSGTLRDTCIYAIQR